MARVSLYQYLLIYIYIKEKKVEQPRVSILAFCFQINSQQRPGSELQMMKRKYKIKHSQKYMQVIFIMEIQQSLM